MMKHLIGVAVLLCIATASFSQEEICPGPLTVTIEGSTTMISLDVDGVTTQPNCNAISGELIGAVDITASGGSPDETGGTPVYHYDWAHIPPLDPSDPSISDIEDLTQLGAGIYRVTVTDTKGCSGIAEFEIFEPTPVQVTGIPVDLICHADSGDPTGSIEITPSGGQGTEKTDYTYMWETATGSGLDEMAADQSELSVGVYSVTVSDANGCTATGSWEIFGPSVVEVSAETVDLSCNASNGPADGQIDITASGGQGVVPEDYVYAWSTEDGSGLDEDVADQTDLRAGTYVVTVTDVNGCTAIGQWTLVQPPFISISASAKSLTCNALSGTADGSIEITVSGGQGTEEDDYTYVWTTDNGSGLVENAASQTGLSAGTYHLLVTDANNCRQSDTYILTEPSVVAVEGMIGNLKCHSESGDADGTINITASGGQGVQEGDYTYLWTTDDGSGLVDGVANQTGLSAGTYTVVVTDANMCTVTESWELIEPMKVECSVASEIVGLGNTNILCAGGTGIFTVTATGGTAPYTYSIDGGVTTQDEPIFGDDILDNIIAGSYTVTVYDANGCESTCEITLTEPPVLMAGTCVVEDECQLNEGEIEVGVEGGVAPYTVTWTSSTGGTLNEGDQIIEESGQSVLYTGAQGGQTYVFEVTDANGCKL